MTRVTDEEISMQGNTTAWSYWALRLVFEDRVFLCGNRTVIFD